MDFARTSCAQNDPTPFTLLAFMLVAVIAASSSLVFAMLPKEAGASLSARTRQVAVQQEPASAPQA